MVLQLPSPTPPIHQLSKGDFTWRAPAAQCPICLQGLNAALYYRNTDFREYVSLVPTSAHTGEGVPDILMLVVQLTQKLMLERIMWSQEIMCTVLEIKARIANTPVIGSPPRSKPTSAAPVSILRARICRPHFIAGTLLHAGVTASFCTGMFVCRTAPHVMRLESTTHAFLALGRNVD